MKLGWPRETRSETGVTRDDPGMIRDDPRSSQLTKLFVLSRHFILRNGVIDGWKITRHQKSTLFRKHEPSVISTKVKTLCQNKHFIFEWPGDESGIVTLKPNSWIYEFKSQKFALFQQRDEQRRMLHGWTLCWTWELLSPCFQAGDWLVSDT